MTKTEHNIYRFQPFVGIHFNSKAEKPFLQTSLKKVFFKAK
jgi:hypothetical protein